MALTNKGIWFSQTTADCSPHWVCETDEPCHNLSTIKNSSNTGNHCQFKLLKWLAQTEPCHSQHGIPKLSFAGGKSRRLGGIWSNLGSTLAVTHIYLYKELYRVFNYVWNMVSSSLKFGKKIPWSWICQCRIQGWDRYKYFGSLNQIENQKRLVLLFLTDTKIRHH